IDRYYFSSMAYQGAHAGNITPERIMERNEAFAPEPDLLVVLDIDPTIGLERIKTRGDRANHFEKTDTLKKAREIFLNIKKPYLCLLDARQDPNCLRDDIVRRFSELYANKIATSNYSSALNLNATLSLFDGGPL
ncbi:MAG: hypothetical protein ABIP06_04035, partial [Pyrinomonadaceae bacterium]